MKFKVRDSFRAKTNHGEMTLEPGQEITLDKDIAIQLLNQGKVKPIGRIAVKIHSTVLGEDIWVVTDGDFHTLQGQITDIVVYAASEIQELKGKPPEHLKAVHDAKKNFPGSKVVGEQDNDN